MKKTRIILAIAAMFIITALLAGCNNDRRTPEDFTQNATQISANVGRALTAEDLQEVERIVRGIVGDYFISVESAEGFAPALNLQDFGITGVDDIEELLAEEYYQLRADIIGDRLVITCTTLNQEMQLEVYSAISTHFGFLREPVEIAEARHNPDMRNIVRVDTDGE